MALSKSLVATKVATIESITYIDQKNGPRAFASADIRCPECKQVSHCYIHKNGGAVMNCTEDNKGERYTHFVLLCSHCMDPKHEYMYVVPIKGFKHAHKESIPKLIELYGDIHVTDEYEDNHYTVILPPSSYVYHYLDIKDFETHECDQFCTIKAMEGKCEICGADHNTDDKLTYKYNPKHIRKMDWWPSRQDSRSSQ